jgi:hypothetical protein
VAIGQPSNRLRQAGLCPPPHLLQHRFTSSGHQRADTPALPRTSRDERSSDPHIWPTGHNPADRRHTAQSRRTGRPSSHLEHRDRPEPVSRAEDVRVERLLRPHRRAYSGPAQPIGGSSVSARASIMLPSQSICLYLPHARLLRPRTVQVLDLLARLDPPWTRAPKDVTLATLLCPRERADTGRVGNGRFRG